MTASEFTFTSNFWSSWIIVLTLANIFACVWLIRWSSKPRPGDANVGDVTGHKWDDDLEELNNPLPRWWLWMFYLSLAFSLVYLVLYPGLGSFRGILNWTQEGAYADEIKQADAEYGPLFAKYAATPISDLVGDADAIKIGNRLFINYCAGCHGSDAGGTAGFPDLRDDAWLYGSEPDTIKLSILDGRNGTMPAWGTILNEQGVEEVTAYVMQLNGRAADTTQANSGQAHFATYCAACHGADAKGNPALGAPDLTNNTWLYGGSPETIRNSIANGRNGHMPAHRDFLGEDKVHLLATYIYSLSNSAR